MFSITSGRIFRKCHKILRLSLLDFSTVPDISKLKLVRTVEKIIANNTSIFIESPIHVKIQPIDVLNIGDHNKLTMKLFSVGKQHSDFQVIQSSKKLELLNSNTNSDRNDVCLITIPYQLKVDVKAFDNACVELNQLEGDDFSVSTESGCIHIANIKTQNLKLESREGSISTAGKVQAAIVDIRSGGQGSVTCEHLLSRSVTVYSHAGPITVHSCYSDRSHYTTAMGNIKLTHVHGSVVIDVIQKSIMHISGFSGNVQASLKRGDVFMHASQLLEKSSIFIHEKGRVEVLLPNIAQNMPAINLIADKITLDNNVLKLGRFMDDSHPKRFRIDGEVKNELHIVCKNGSIELKDTDIPFFL